METIINRGYKFKIVPTKEQKEFFLQSFGCARKNVPDFSEIQVGRTGETIH